MVSPCSQWVHSKIWQVLVRHGFHSILMQHTKRKHKQNTTFTSKHTGPTTVCLASQSINGGRHSTHPPHHPISPGQKSELCEMFIDYILHHSSFHAHRKAQGPGIKHLSVQVGPWLPDRQTSDDEVHPSHWSSPGLCFEPPAVRTWLCSHFWLQHHCQVCWRHSCSGPDNR